MKIPTGKSDLVSSTPSKRTRKTKLQTRLLLIMIYTLLLEIFLEMQDDYKLKHLANITSVNSL